MANEILPKPTPIKLRNSKGEYTKYCTWCLEEDGNKFTPIGGWNFLCKTHYAIYRRKKESMRIKERRRGVITQSEAKKQLDGMLLSIYGNRHNSIKRYATIRSVILKQYNSGVISEGNATVLLRVLDIYLKPLKKEKLKFYIKKHKETTFKIRRKRRNTEFMKDRIVKLSKNNENNNEIETNTK